MSIKFRVEIAYSVYKDIEIVGWAIGKRPNTELSFQFCEEDGTVVNYVLRRYHRGDVMDSSCGFLLKKRKNIF